MYLQNEVANQYIKESLNGGHQKKDGHFGEQITVPAQVEKGLALQNLPVPDNFFRTHRQAHEQGYDDAHQEKRGKVVVEPENVFFAARRALVFDDKGQDDGQQRSFQQIDKQVLFVADLGKKIADRKNGSLSESRGDIQIMRRDLLDIFHPGDLETLL